MSDLSLQLQQAASQLPVSSYFDEALFRRELETIFQRGPRYVGHTNAVPNVGDYYALPQEGEGRALIRTERGVELVSNICRHRQAVMLKGRGNLGHTQAGSAGGNIVCPLHRWTYSGGSGMGKLGELIGDARLLPAQLLFEGVAHLVGVDPVQASIGEAQHAEMLQRAELINLLDKCVVIPGCGRLLRREVHNGRDQRQQRS